MIVYDVYADNCFIQRVNTISSMEMLEQRLRNKGHVVRIERLIIED